MFGIWLQLDTEKLLAALSVISYFLMSISKKNLIVTKPFTFVRHFINSAKLSYNNVAEVACYNDLISGYLVISHLGVEMEVLGR